MIKHIINHTNSLISTPNNTILNNGTIPNNISRPLLNIVVNKNDSILISIDYFFKDYLY
jgi:hypothetical protein